MAICAKRRGTATGFLLALMLASAGALGGADTSYTVRKGDSVWLIAKRFAVPPNSILTANDLTANATIRPGDRLVIPTAAASDRGAVDGTHVVQSGETLWSIARRYGTTVTALANANALDPERALQVGARLKVPAGKGPDVVGWETEDIYAVQPGDSLSQIARRYGTTAGALAARNGLRKHGVLRAGRRLVVPGKPAAAAAQPSGEARRAGDSRARYYVVARGDTLSQIARDFSTTPDALARLNGRQVEDVLPVGLRLRVRADAQGSPRAADTGTERSPRAADTEAGRSQRAADTGAGPRFVRTAMKYRGVRYRYGGMTKRGMDCSGLVARVLQTHGIDAPHSSKGLYRLGKPVRRADLSPGDLVFFHTTRAGISHVGFYVGDGKFIHASSGSGRVKVSRLDNGYYHRRYVGARRLE